MQFKGEKVALLPMLAITQLFVQAQGGAVARAHQGADAAELKGIETLIELGQGGGNGQHGVTHAGGAQIEARISHRLTLQWLLRFPFQIYVACPLTPTPEHPVLLIRPLTAADKPLPLLAGGDERLFDHLQPYLILIAPAPQCGQIPRLNRAQLDTITHAQYHPLPITCPCYRP
ncbi:hypothetical protein AERO9A_420248 [Aeromonas salmonicida]|nr:hypothetical protein AERO9A_420248 [Aeromonas salmonicida]